jgi:hypothetical protein
MESTHTILASNAELRFLNASCALAVTLTDLLLTIMLSVNSLDPQQYEIAS